MLHAFRAWLESELKLLGNASHHAYSFGQANMASRAIARLDAELAGQAVIVLPMDDAIRALAALGSSATAVVSDPALAGLRDALADATSGTTA